MIQQDFAWPQWRNRVVSEGQRSRWPEYFLAGAIALLLGAALGLWAGERDADVWWQGHAITEHSIVNAACGNDEGKIVEVFPAQ